ncbi:hypothetical protein PoMZ_04992 [Pyricularia oryzae]|uniref:Uncharacterized protein n=1 Tax=Pyricularia oryzae TaxID=318829 RepID=A0A4P7ND90_PYROR|nr:hypothetical protein PoMZ_04992 [Pyricularia oryzae]
MGSSIEQITCNLVGGKSSTRFLRGLLIFSAPVVGELLHGCIRPCQVRG